MSNAIDLSLLAPPEVLQPVDFEATLARMLATLRNYDPSFTTVSEADPAYKILEVAAYYVCHRITAANNDARALLLAFATGANLDHIGVTYFGGTARHILQAANPTASPPIPEVRESDDDYRRRLQLYPSSMSVAGPTGAYVFHALGAHANVSDATAVSPAPAHVTITVLGRNADNIPDAETLAAVESALNADTVRPVADRVTVQAATIVDYTIAAAVTVPSGPDASTIARSIAANIKSYTDAPRRLGRDIARSAIYAALHIAGVERVDLTHPSADVVLDASKASRCTSISVTLNGVQVEI